MRINTYQLMLRVENHLSKQTIYQFKWKLVMSKKAKNITTSRGQRVNPNARNFGLGSRDMKQAGVNALKEKFAASQIGFKSVAVQGQRFGQFTSYIRDSFNVRDMRSITQDHVRQYAQELDSRISGGSLSAKAAHDYLAAVNSVLGQASGHSDLRVTASEAGLPDRSGITTVNKAISESQHHKVQSQLDDRLKAISSMQRSLGMRFEEACKNNPTSMYKEAVDSRTVTISEGTKGGQSRTVPIINPNQLDALRNASAVQGNHHSMIPAHQTYAQFQSQSYKTYHQLGYQTHSERHAYAQHSYREHIRTITGVSDVRSPIESGYKHGQAHHQYIADKVNYSPEKAKQLDHQVREMVAKELGHHRIDITNAYLG